MPASNEIYNAPADIWWADDQPLNMIRTALNPVRLRYLKQVLARSGADPAGKTVADIGCGGGLLAEELARLGANVIGVDPSAASLRTARAHAQAAGLSIDYRLGSGERLPLPDASADIACCADVLEHVSDVPAVLRETARILKPGGVYLYDTINRTPLSWLVVIRLSQDWAPTAWAPRDLHHYSQFITPAELHSLLRASGLSDGGHAGIRPPAGPLRILRQLRRARTGQISYAELGRRLEFALATDTRISYIGHALKNPPRPPGCLSRRSGDVSAVATARYG
jgi:2-polyprenyl-6-hydroxyphenyl methylase / 3-demethylubiquinone-9 3-methyltransferase